MGELLSFLMKFFEQRKEKATLQAEKDLIKKMLSDYEHSKDQSQELPIDKYGLALGMIDTAIHDQAAENEKNKLLPASKDRKKATENGPSKNHAERS